MSFFLNYTPTVQVVVENAFSSERYPVNETVVAVIDTGYEGFLAVPIDVFHRLGFNELQPVDRTLVLANGSVLTSKGVYAAVKLPHISFKLDGFIETYDGLDEIILGVEALSRFKSTFDYCSQRITIQPCP